MFDITSLPVKIVAITTIIIAVILSAVGFGYMKGKEGAKAAIADYELQASKQIAELKEMNAAISGKITIKYVDRINTIKEKEIRYVDIATHYVPSQFELSNGWVYTHDIGSTGGDADPARSSDASPSGIKDNQGLVTVLHNYSICEQRSAQINNLQQWILDNKAAIDASNLKKEQEAKKKKRFGVF